MFQRLEPVVSNMCIELQVSVLLSGDFGLHIDRTKLTDGAGRLFKQPEFLEKLGKTLQDARQVELGQPSIFGKLMARIDKDCQSDTPERLASQTA